MADQPDRSLAFEKHARPEGLAYGGGPHLRPTMPTVSRYYRWRDPQVLVDFRSEVEREGRALEDVEREYAAKREYAARESPR